MRNERMQKTIDKITSAFPAGAPLLGENIVANFSWEDAERVSIREAFAGKRWTEVDRDALERNRTCLAFFTPEAFHAYIPAILIWCLDEPLRADVLIDYAIESLAPLRPDLTAPSPSRGDHRACCPTTGGVGAQET